MLQEAFDAAERGGALPDLDVGGSGDGGCLATLHPHRQHAAEAAPHLPHGGGMPGVRGEARIEHRLDSGVAREVLGDGHSAGALVAHAHVQSAYAAQQQRRLERTNNAAQHAAQPCRALEVRILAGEDERAGHHIGMAVEVLGAGMHDQINPKFQRPLINRRGKCAVNQGDEIASLRQCRRLPQVNHPQRGIGR